MLGVHTCDGSRWGSVMSFCDCLALGPHFARCVLFFHLLILRGGYLLYTLKLSCACRCPLDAGEELYNMYSIDTDSWPLYPPRRGKAGRALCARLLFEALATALSGIFYIICYKRLSQGQRPFWPDT